MNRSKNSLAEKSSDNANELLAQALQHHQAGNLSEAERLYQEILGINPDHADSLHLLGVAAAQTGQHERAVSLISQAIRLNNKIPYYHNNLGSTYNELGQLDEARTCFQYAIELKSDYADALNNLGLIFFTRRNLEAAATQFKNAIAADPDHPNAHKNLAAILFNTGDIDESLRLYRRAHTLMPRDTKVFLQTKVVQFFKSPMTEWGDICREALGWPHLTDEQRFGTLIHFAMYYWAMGDRKNMFETLEATRNSPLATKKAADKGIYGSQMFRNFLLAVSDYYDNNPFLPPSCEETINIIGDSHCLSYANTQAVIDGMPRKTVPHLIPGCKAWHLGNQASNQYKASFQKIMERMPQGSRCIISAGEIDCRYNDGIIERYKKHGGDLDSMIDSTAKDYVKNVCVAAQKQNVDASFLNIPAPYCDIIHIKDPALTAEDEKLLIYVVRRFNEGLAQEAAKHSRQIIDIYRLTSGPNGSSIGIHHLDSHHLKPYVLSLAFGNDAQTPVAHNQRHSVDDQKASLRQTLSLAVQFQQNGNLDEAEKLYKRVLDIDPNNTDSLHLLGVIAAEKGQPDRGIDLIRQAINLNNNCAYFHNNIGKIYRDLERFDEAREHLERAIELKPDYAEAHNNLAAVAMANRQKDLALKHINQALSFDKNNANAINNLGSLALDGGDIDEAIRLYERALNIQPTDSNSLTNLSVALFQKHPVEEWNKVAEILFNKPHLQDKNKYDILVMLAIHYWCAGNWAAFVDCLQKSQVYPWATNPNLDSKLKNTWVFRHFLICLYDYYMANPTEGYPYTQQIALIGDSHCLTYANTTIPLNGVLHKISPHLVIGCKAFHLGQTQPNRHKATFDAVLKGIPANTKCIMSMGEIDCRYDGGIIKHYKKYGGDLDNITATTAQRYVKMVSTKLHGRQNEILFLNVPAPNIAALRNNADFTPQDEEMLPRVIREFNRCLEQEAKAQGHRVIDIYALTADDNGLSTGAHHIDSHHLKPYILNRALNENVSA